MTNKIVGRPEKYTAEQVIRAVVGSGAVVSEIARRLRCDWHTAKKYIEKYKTVQQAVDDENNQTVDMARAVVIAAIQGGDVGSAKWWLTKKAPAEFGDRVGIDAGGEVTVVVEYQETEAPGE